MRTRIAICLLLGFVLLAHVALWQSDRLPFEVKLRLTLINAAGWAVVWLPIYAVGRWLRAHQGRDDG